MPSAQAANTYSISVKATDAQLRSASGSASLTVLAPVTFVPIHTIQGNTPGTTPYSGKTVQTSGIVTGVLVNGFYLQAKDAAADTDPATSEGIFVHTGTGNVPATAVLGNELQVSGTVSLYPSTAVTPGTELDTPAGISILSTANPMPSAIALTTTYPTPGGGVYQLLRYQSMRVTASPSFTTTEGTQGTQPSEAAETYVSNGQFYGTVTGVARPTREAGLEVLDPLTASQPSTIARFDDNPELIMVDSDAMVGGSGGPLDVTSNTVLTNMTGVMDFSGGAPLFIVDAAARPTVSGGMSYLAVTPAKAGEITIGDQNMERFYNNVKDTAGAVVLTDAAYALRLAKGSLVVRNVLRSPDILCLEEMENLATLTDLSNKISADAQAAGQTDPKYAPYLIQGNDSSAINVAFLINTSKIDVLDVSQFGKDTTYTNASNTQATLNDRPPLVLHAGIKRAGTTDYPVTVIVNHLRSLNGVTDNTTSGQNVRTKREKQAEFLANLIQGYQTNGEHIVTVGDYNAFDVNDGVVDSLGIIRGAAAPSSQDIIPGPAFNLVSPSLVDAAPTNVASGAYSYVYVGNAQSIDHVLVSQDIAPLIRTSPAHFDADFPQIYRNDATRPEVSSDHDGIVAYLAVPAGTFIGLSPTSLTFATQPLQTTTSQTVTVSNSGSAAISFTSIVTAAPFSQTNTCGTSLAGGAQCVIAVSFKPTATGPVSGTLTLTDSDATTTQTVALSGTGAGVYSTLLLNASPSSTVVGTSVNLIANVGGNGAATPTGNVSFFDGSTLLGSANISGGTATLTTKALAIGAHSITATYNGDTLYPAVTSSVVTVSITAAPVPDFTFSVSNSSLIVSGSNPSSSTTVNVAYVNGFSSPVTFACAGMPTNSRCSFTPATLTATGTSTLTVIINSGSASMAPVRSPFNRNSGTALAFALLSLPLVLRKRHRHTLRAATGVAALLLSVVLLTLTGCGSGGSLNVPKGTTSITVTATGGSISHASTFTLNVQ